MYLKNDYKVLYEARLRATEEKPETFFASKGIISLEDPAVKAYDKSGKEVKIRDFSLVYMKDGKIYGSMTKLPSEEDSELLIKAGDDIILGEDDGTVVVDNEEDLVKDLEDESIEEVDLEVKKN